MEEEQQQQTKGWRTYTSQTVVTSYISSAKKNKIILEHTVS